MEADRQVSRGRRPGTALAALLALLLIAVVPGASAHPSHSSYAEVEWSDEGTLDVALRVIPEDLERALSLHAGRRLVLVDTPAVREVLVGYLQVHFRFEETGAGDSVLPHLVGMELDHRDTWIYFSLAAPPDRARPLRNSLLMDLEPGQTNRVRRLWAPAAPVLVFSSAEPTRSLAVPVE